MATEDLKQEVARIELQRLLDMRKDQTDIINQRSAASAALISPLQLKVPFLSRFANETHDTTTILTGILDTKQRAFSMGYTESSALMGGLYFGGIGLAVIDFLRIPAIYLASYLLGQKVPITVNKNARWLYSGVILGLFIGGTLFPPAALAIGFVIAGAGFGISAFLLGRTLYNRYQLTTKLHDNQKALHLENTDLSTLQDDAQKLYNEFALDSNLSDEQLEQIHAKVLEKEKEFDEQLERIVYRKGKIIRLESEIKQIEKSQIFDKSFGLAVASVGVIGLGISVVLPPVGLLILASASFVGASYFSGRLISSAVNYFASRNSKAEPVVASTEALKHNSTHTMINAFASVKSPAKVKDTDNTQSISSKNSNQAKTEDLDVVLDENQTQTKEQSNDDDITNPSPGH